MNYMFYGCSSLEELNLSNFNTNNVIYMNGMFLGCSSLKELNISNFNFDKVTDIDRMFAQCTNELITKIEAQFKKIDYKAFS